VHSLGLVVFPLAGLAHRSFAAFATDILADLSSALASGETRSA
jgi:hypothetical protein